MIDVFDNMLRHLFLANIDEITSESQVRFQPPDDTWRTYVSNLTVNGQPASALNVYLVDLRENRTLRTQERVRDLDRGLYGETPAPRWMDCHYVISAWSPATVTPTIEPSIDEHALIYKCIAVLMQSEPLIASQVYAPDPLPPGFPPILADAELWTHMLPVDGFPKIAEFWGTFGATHPWRPMAYFIVALPVLLRRTIAGPMVTTRITEYRQPTSADPAEICIQIGGITTAAGQPVANAWVQLEDTLTTPLQVTTTDEQGHFTFSALQQGPFVLRVRAQGHNETTKAITVPSPRGNYDVQLI
jgi:hypothetical protein